MGTAFERHFGCAPRFAAAAPGRVNLIGEHTDYNDGFVMPMAINRRTCVLASLHDDRRAKVVSTAQDDAAEFEISAGLRPGEPKWANYVRGPFALLSQRGWEIPGVNVLIDTTVPLGGGLSSSAALVVAMATLIEAVSGRVLEPKEKALLCQESDHKYAGVPCGIMDQFISVMGRAGHALLIDCRTLETQPVPIYGGEISVLVVNSNCRHELVGGEYAARRSQCHRAAELLGVPALRDATMSMLESAKDRLSTVEYRRARHVIGEQQRTLAAADAMQRRSWDEVGRLLYASHASLRDDFEVSTPELDLLVELARQHEDDGVYGCRMTGGGFGGCVVALTRAGTAEAIGQRIAERYHGQTGIEPSWFVAEASAGAQQVPL